MERALVISAVLFGLVCFVNAQLQCNAITGSDLGSTTELSTDGIISQALSPGGETGNNPVSVQISQYRILCDASGFTRNTSSYVSILVEFQCSSPTVSACDGTNVLTRQFQFQCSSANEYSTTVFGTDTFAVTENPTATFSTSPDNRCRACVDDQQDSRASADTHCWPCTATCTEGLRRCYIPSSGPEQCCNFYLEDDCVESCPSSLVSNDNFDCVCPEIALGNGTVTYTNGFAIDSVAEHVCNDGYSLRSDIGATSRTCTTNGWDGLPITCDLITCPDLNIQSGSVVVIPDDQSVNSTATYSCNSGYSLEGGDPQRNCQYNGQWDGTAPTCEFIRCPDLTVSNGIVVVSPNDQSLDSVATYSCNSGYSLEGGDRQRYCQNNGLWNGTAPTCDFIRCPDLTVPNGNVVVIPNDQSLNSVATYSCNSDYSLEGGNSVRHCQSDREWNGTAPSCGLITCPDLTVLSGNVDFSPSDRSVDSVATYSCNSGYSLKGGNRQRYCQNSGQWNGTTPSCEFIRCPNLTLPNGSVVVSPEDQSLNSVATYSCNSGYTLSFREGGNIIRHCQSSRQWNGTAPSCDFIRCPDLIVSNGIVVISPDDQSLDSVATYSCNNGYSLERGDRQRHCQNNRQWNGTTPSCDFIRCPDLVAPNGNVVVIPNDQSLNSVATYSCNSGYSLEGEHHQRHCQNNSQWNGTAPSCGSITCPNDLTVSNGIVGYSTNDQSVNSTATYSCNDGYSLEGGSHQRYCQNSGQWNGTSPTCDLIRCPDLTVPNGNVVVTPNDQSVNSVATYSCNSSYGLEGGNNQRHCQNNRQWNGTAPACNKSSSDSLLSCREALILTGVICSILCVILGFVLGLLCSYAYVTCGRSHAKPKEKPSPDSQLYRNNSCHDNPLSPSTGNNEQIEFKDKSSDAALY